MNNNILLKCLKELGEQSPRIDYVRGMLETLAELNSPPLLQVGKDAKIEPVIAPKPVIPSPDDGGLLDAMAMANLKKVRDIAAQSIA